MAWSTTRGAPLLTTPILYGDLLYVCEAGILAAYNVETGQRVYQVRLPGAGSHSFAASPVASDGKLYFTGEDGDVTVVKAGPTLEQLSVNQMGEVLMATPAITPGMIIFPMQHHVVAVAEAGAGQQ